MRAIHLVGWRHEAPTPDAIRLSAESDTAAFSLRSLELEPGATRFALDDDDIWALALPRFIAAAVADDPGATIIAPVSGSGPAADFVELAPEAAIELAGAWRRWIDYLFINEPLAELRLPWPTGDWQQGPPAPDTPHLETASLAEPRHYRSGDPVTTAARSILRAVDPWGQRWPDPFDDARPDSFREWLDERDSTGLPRFARSIYWSRPDLRASFPDTSAPADLDSWLQRNDLGPAIGDARRRSPLRRLRPKRHTIGDRRLPPGAADGVNVVGYLSAQSGLGQAARLTVEALDGLAVSTADVSHRIHSPRLNRGAGDGTPHDVSIFHLNPPELVGYAHDSLAMRLGAAWSIGFFFWETATVPADWQEGLGAVDEIWVASEFTRATLQPTTESPVEVVGMAIDEHEATADRHAWGLDPDTFVCAYVTDALSGRHRKNPVAAVEAFEAAFPPAENASLLLKVANLGADAELAQELSDRSSDGRVRIITEDLDRGRLWSLLATADVYLSLHSAESLGLTLLEAMSLGIPVIATGYGGNTDYLTAANGIIVPHEMVPARGGIYEGLGEWAAPDIEAAAAGLRDLRNDPELRRRLGDEAQRTVAARYTPQVYGNRLRARLRSLGLS